MMYNSQNVEKIPQAIHQFLHNASFVLFF